MCGGYYTDKSGHDYDVCVETLQDLCQSLLFQVGEVSEMLYKAQAIRSQDWWKPLVAQAKRDRGKKLADAGGIIMGESSHEL